MSDLKIRAVEPVVPAQPSAPADTASAPTSAALPSDIDARASNPPRSYIVFGSPNLGLQPPQTNGRVLRGTTPDGEAWQTARMTEAEARSLEQSGVRIVEDREVTLPVIRRRPGDVTTNNLFARDIHGANELAKLGPAWEGEGGLFIGVDTGVAPHPDLPATSHFDNVFTDAPEDPQADPNSHGTHTIGSAAARGNPETGGTRGMAPRSTIAGVQVLDENGRGTWSSVLKGVERAIEWAKTHDGFVVVNLSLGGTAGDPTTDPIVQAIEAATREHGILFSVSAGNEGSGEGTIGTPGIAPSALTVGAMDHKGTLDAADDAVAWFSSRDVPTGGKPNITARGVNVRSTIPGGGYDSYDGTSMAAPIAGGGALAVGQGLLEMYRRGELTVDPRDLVRSGEFQRILAEAALDNPSVPHNVEGAGDLRLVRTRQLFVERFGAHVRGPAPYYPGRTPPSARPRYRLPF